MVTGEKVGKWEGGDEEPLEESGDMEVGKSLPHRLKKIVEDMCSSL